MKQRDIWRAFEALPADAQRQVEDFIAFLQSRQEAKSAGPGTQPDLKAYPFVGMWQDHEEMEDSRAWVRSRREQEWQRR